MEEMLKYLGTVTDNRQEKKVKHKMSDIIALVFFAMLANANEWVEIETFGKEHEEFFYGIGLTFRWSGRQDLKSNKHLLWFLITSVKCDCCAIFFCL